METQKEHLTEKELEDVNKRIESITLAICEKLENSGTRWLPIMVYAIKNIMRIATEMNKDAGVKTDLRDMTQTFCNQLLEAVEFSMEQEAKNNN